MCLEESLVTTAYGPISLEHPEVCGLHCITIVRSVLTLSLGLLVIVVDVYNLNMEDIQ